PGAWSLECLAWDQSNLRTDDPWCIGYEGARYDPNLPSGTATCYPNATSPGFACPATKGASWVSGFVRVILSCTDATSGCYQVRYTLDDAPGSMNGTYAYFDITAEGQHQINATYEDTAGNVRVAAPVWVGVDNTPPTQADVSEVHGAPLIRVDPTWHVSATDALSPVHYRFALNNATITGSLSNGNLTVTNGPEGMNCLVATAIDAAGNAAAPSAASCVFVDRVAPQAAVVSPPYGYVMKNDQTWLATSGATIALGDFSLNTTASDPNGASGSGLAEHKTTKDGADWTPTEGTNQCDVAIVACVQHYAAATHGYGWRSFNVVARDAAGNAVSPGRSVAVTNLVAYSGTTYNGLPYTSLEWLQFPQAGIVGVEIHRSTSSVFAPSALTKVADASSTSATSWTDPAPPPGNWYYV